jgi:hypothetical protein
MSRGSVGVSEVDGCNGRMDQHYQYCGACGDVTHEGRLTCARSVLDRGSTCCRCQHSTQRLI